MKREQNKEPRPHKDARRSYRQARSLKRLAAALAHAVPHSIIHRGLRA